MPPSLPALFSGAGRFIHVVPELDPYHQVRREAVAGPLAPLPVPVKSQSTTDYFAYLGVGTPGLKDIFATLNALNQRGSAYIRGADTAMIHDLAHCGVQCFTHPTDLVVQAVTARGVLHHGGASTTLTALALGIPQFVMPNHMEQYLTGHRLKQLGVGGHSNPG